jgi:hypothetical protein
MMFCQRLTRIVFLSLLMLSGCSRASVSPTSAIAADIPTLPVASTPAQTPVTVPHNAGLATPVADSPAAGICARFDGLLVTMQILPGIPDPRCVQVRGEQQLSITNRTEDTIGVTLGPFDTRLAPGQEFLITTPFEDYLAPGVHAVMVTPCCGGEIVYGIDLGN